MRKLSIRERALLLCLAVVAFVSGYHTFFPAAHGAADRKACSFSWNKQRSLQGSWIRDWNPSGRCNWN